MGDSHSTWPEKNRTCTKLKAINLDNLNKGVSVLKIT